MMLSMKSNNINNNNNKKNAYELKINIKYTTKQQYIYSTNEYFTLFLKLNPIIKLKLN